MTTPETRPAPAERADAAALARQEGAVEAEPLLREVLAAVPDLILVLNAQRQVVFANHVLADFLGLGDGADPRGMRPGELFGCVNARNDTGGCGTTERCRSCGLLSAVLAAVDGRAERRDARIALETGDALDLRVSTRPLKIAGEALLVAALQDIADEKRRQVLERVFFHDVMNTAGGVKGLVGLLRDVEPSRMGTIVDMLEESATRLVEEIQVHRLLAAAEGGDYAPRVEDVDAMQVWREVLSTYLPLSRTEQVRLQMAGVPHGLTFQTDRTLLGRVLGNLVKNAIEASEPGMAVLVGAKPVQGAVEFWVHNQTVMPEHVRNQVFQRSFSTKDPGRGLGTYSVRLFTERYLSGRVTFLSDEESGTTFRVRLPLVWR